MLSSVQLVGEVDPSEGISFVDLPDDISGFGEGFLVPAMESLGGVELLDPSDMRYVAVRVLDAKIVIPATSAASFTTHTSNR